MIAYRLLNDVCIDCFESIHKFGEDQESYFECLFNFPEKDRVKQAEIALQICDYNSVYSYVERLEKLSHKLGILTLEQICENILENIINEEYDDVVIEMQELRKSYENIVNVINKAKQLRQK